MHHFTLFFLYCLHSFYLVVGSNLYFPPGIDCLRFDVTPSSFSTINPFTDLSVNIKFKSPPSFIFKGSWYPIIFFTSFFKDEMNQNEYIYLLAEKNKKGKRVDIKSISVNLTSIDILFNGEDILPSSTFILFVSERFSLEGFNYTMPAQSWVKYNTFESNITTLSPPSIQESCPIKYKIPDINYTPSPFNTSNITASATLKTTNNESFILEISVITSGNMNYPFSLSTLKDAENNIYKLANPLNSIFKISELEINAMLDKKRSISPVYNALFSDLDSSSYLMWEEIDEQIAQTYFDLVAQQKASIRLMPGLFNKNADVLSASEIAHIFYLEDFYQANIEQNNGTIISLYYGVKGHIDKRWYMSWLNENKGITCQKGSHRNIYGPNFSKICHTLANISNIKWTPFNITNLKLSRNMSFSLSVNEFYSSYSNGNDLTPYLDDSTFEISSSIVNDYDSLKNTLEQNMLVVPDIIETSPENQKFTNWLFIPKGVFHDGTGSTCNTINVNSFDFINQGKDFCNLPHGSCLENQLGKFISDKTYRAFNKLNNSIYLTGDTTSSEENKPFPRARIVKHNDNYRLKLKYNGNSDLVNTKIYIKINKANLTFLEPAITIVSSNLEIKMNNTISISAIVKNTGNLQSYFYINVSCPVGFSTSSFPICLKPNQEKKLESIVEITSTNITGDITCTGTISIPSKSLWKNANSVELPKSITSFYVYENTIHNIYDKDLCLFLDCRTWMLMVNEVKKLENSNSLIDVKLNDIWEHSLNFKLTNKLIFNIITYGTIISDVETLFSCSNEGKILVSEKNSFSDIVPSKIKVVAIPFSVDLLKFKTLKLSCNLSISLPTKKYKSLVGKNVINNFTIAIPDKMCISNYHEPYLFLNKLEWENMQFIEYSTGKTHSLMTFNSKIVSELNLTNRPKNLVSVYSTLIKNVGFGAGNLTVTSSCSDSVFLDTSQSTYNLGPNESMNIELSFYTNNNINKSEIGCIVTISIAMLPCWSSIGKKYSQYLSVKVPEGLTDSVSFFHIKHTRKNETDLEAEYSKKDVNEIKQASIALDAFGNTINIGKLDDDSSEFEDIKYDAYNTNIKKYNNSTDNPPEMLHFVRYNRFIDTDEGDNEYAYNVYDVYNSEVSLTLVPSIKIVYDS